MFDIEFGCVRIARIRPRCITSRRQGHVSHAQQVIDPQHTQRSAQRVSTLNTDQRTYLMVLVRRIYVWKAQKKQSTVRTYTFYSMAIKVNWALFNQVKISLVPSNRIKFDLSTVDNLYKK
jgi:hypothetical protein